MRVWVYVMFLNVDCNFVTFLDCVLDAGEKLSEEECSELFTGQEDASGNINYEGKHPHIVTS